jgi:hypothetical protein
VVWMVVLATWGVWSRSVSKRFRQWNDRRCMLLWCREGSSTMGVVVEAQGDEL